MADKQLGRISSARFGFGGYQDAQIGLSLSFEGPSWGVSHFDGHWGIERSDGAAWTEKDRIHKLGETVMSLKDTLVAAKAQDVAGLIGKPVEVTFEMNTLKSWRILEEVL